MRGWHDLHPNYIFPVLLSPSHLQGCAFTQRPHSNCFSRRPNQMGINGSSQCQRSFWALHLLFFSNCKSPTTLPKSMSTVRVCVCVCVAMEEVIDRFPQFSFNRVVRRWIETAEQQDKLCEAKTCFLDSNFDLIGFESWTFCNYFIYIIIIFGEQWWQWVAVGIMYQKGHCRAICHRHTHTATCQTSWTINCYQLNIIITKSNGI